MNIADNEKLGRIWFEDMWSKPDLEIAEKLVEPNYSPNWIHINKKGPDLVKYEISQFRSIFPDLKFEILEMKGEEEKVWIRYKGRATHKGEGWGFAPTHKKVEFEGAAILYINSNGKVIDMWDMFCFYDMLTDIGVVPPLWELHKYLNNYKNSH